MVDLESLTDIEIRQKFEDLGESVGPITSTTRKLYLKKLQKLLDAAGSSHNLSTPNIQTGSGDEEEDGGKSRRRSMPPPRTKSPRRKSPARQSAAPDPSPPKARPRDSPLPPNKPDPRRSSRRSEVKPSGSLFGTNHVDDDAENSYNRSGEASDFLNNSSSPPRYTNSALGLGLSDNFKSRLMSTSPLTNRNTSYSDRTSNLGSSLLSSKEPFSSDFVRRLSSGRNSGGVATSYTHSASLNSKLLDVKESDDEDSGSMPVYAKFSQGRSYVPQSSRPYTQNNFSGNSKVALLLFIVFGGLAIFYFSSSKKFPEDAITAGIKFPKCFYGPDGSPGVGCIEQSEKELVKSIFSTIVQELTSRASTCDSSETPSISEEEVLQHYIDKKDDTVVWHVERNFPFVKAVVAYNPEMHVVTSSNKFVLTKPPYSFICTIYGTIRKFISYAFYGVVGLGSLYLLYKGYVMNEAYRNKHKNEVFAMANDILNIVSSKTQCASYVAINHVRDMLIPPQDRDKKNRVWYDAVAYLEGDSRIRREVQLVEGEEFDVWRWLASPVSSANKKKVWQGQAFETMEGSVNSLSHSPTPCLKIRHMFDAANEEGDDWVATVVDAILVKCKDAEILHIVVDQQSREGCVYMKCASPQHAGIAYRALHGSWFDSNLVTVKYIREARYLERFPESAQCIHPLQPSNKNKN